MRQQIGDNPKAAACLKTGMEILAKTSTSWQKMRRRPP